MTSRTALVVAVALGVLLMCAGATAQAAGYHLISSIPLPTVTGWDYLKIDPERRELFISNNSGIIVIDIDTFREIGSIPSPAKWPGVGLVHGVATADSLGLGFISREIPPSIVTFSLSSLRVLRSTRTRPGTDAIVFEPITKRVFSFNGKFPGVHDVTVMNAASGKKLGNIALPGIPEFPVADGRGHVYDNVSSVSELAEISARTLKVIRLWHTWPCVHPSALAMDPVNRRLFAACQNHMMVMISANTGKILGSVPTGAGVDSARFDPGTGDVFAASASGILTIAREVSPDRLVVLQQLKTAREGRSMALDPRTHRVFVMTAKFGQPPTDPGKDNPHDYPSVLHGSARLLVFGP